MFLESLKLDGLLSFAPGTEAFKLEPLNVVIGPNGSGKSNLIEAIELLRALPSGFANAIREGGGIREWLWKGDEGANEATIEVIIESPVATALRYSLGIVPVGARVEIKSELLEGASSDAGSSALHAFYRRSNGESELFAHDESSVLIRLDLLRTDESVLSQWKDPVRYPELTWLGEQLSRIQTFREWRFGRGAALRQPQTTDLATDGLAPDARNLPLLINQLEHGGGIPRLQAIMRRFFPRFLRFTTPVIGNTIQLYLHEEGLKTPISSTRLSDGTLRFVAMLVLLLHPDPPPLICIEEPELGLHPDALAIIGELLLEARSRTQLIVTTHSDALVSAMTSEVETVVVCEHLGGTTLRRLESQRLTHWLDKYRLGDIWTMGELGGNP
jgi:predicted ATPase